MNLKSKKTDYKSKDLFKSAKRSIPGGVNSPVRAFKAVGGTPVFFEKAKGAYVIKTIKKQVDKALTFGAPTELEVQLAEKICSSVPGMEMIRMVNSGTEATMSAIRLARAYTGRDKIVKFEGCSSLRLVQVL